jgi:hypothetical protein
METKQSVQMETKQKEDEEVGIEHERRSQS